MRVARSKIAWSKIARQADIPEGSLMSSLNGRVPRAAYRFSNSIIIRRQDNLSLGSD